MHQIEYKIHVDCSDYKHIHTEAGRKIIASLHLPNSATYDPAVTEPVGGDVWSYASEFVLARFIKYMKWCQGLGKFKEVPDVWLYDARYIWDRKRLRPLQVRPGDFKYPLRKQVLVWSSRDPKNMDFEIMGWAYNFEAERYPTNQLGFRHIPQSDLHKDDWVMYDGSEYDRNRQVMQGIRWKNRIGKWAVAVIIDGQIKRLGMFDTFKEAVFARREAYAN